MTIRIGTISSLAVIPDFAARAPARPAKQGIRGPRQAAGLAALLTLILLPTEAAATTKFQGYYQLQTKFLEGESRCLEGNRPGGSKHGGAAFMDLCRNVSGQLWRVVGPDQDGYYRLKTQFLRTQNKCLEGNRPGGATLGGAAFMDTCKDVTGQLWKIESLGLGYYRLKTKFLEKESRCLEGNRPGGSKLGGAAFMDRCQNVTGQKWRFVPRCTPKPSQGWPKCRTIASPKIQIYGSRLVSDAAMDVVRLVYAAMTSRFTAQYPRTQFNDYEVYITNGEDRSVLATLEPAGTMWGRDNVGLDKADELRGGTNNDFLWISEQMICKTGVATRNRAYEKGKRDAMDDETRTFDQVIHEFGHAIDYRFGLRSEIDTVFRNSQQPEEAWAWAVQRWFGAPPLPQGGGFTAEVSRMLSGLFTSQTTFSCQQYSQWN